LREAGGALSAQGLQESCTAAALEAERPGTPPPVPPLSLAEGCDAGALLRRAVERCDAGAGGAPADEDADGSWASLRPVALALSHVESWMFAQAAAKMASLPRAAGPPAEPPRPAKRRRVCFAPHDGSHLAPSRWGDADPSEIADLAEAAERMHRVVTAQQQWHDRVAAAGEAAGEQRAVRALRLEVAAAADEALCAAHLSDEASRCRAAGSFMCSQLEGLADGVPVLSSRLSELLRSLLRQQLRLLFETDDRNEARLEPPPRANPCHSPRRNPLGARPRRCSRRCRAGAGTATCARRQTRPRRCSRSLCTTTTHTCASPRQPLRLPSARFAPRRGFSVSEL